jgi:type VI secretion system secreted protein VgrG
MGFPAARVTDMHVCPMVTGVVPHVGGPILPPCAVTVLTGSLPQARVGDMCTCVGPPDIIVKGAMTVIVSGQPAARMLDNTAHGGMIILGLPTVLIGDAGGGGGAGGSAGGPLAPVTGAPGTPVQIDPALLGKSPTLAGQLDRLAKQGWAIQYGKPGGGSFCDKSAKIITVDPNDKDNPGKIVQTVSHEAGHALYKAKPDASSRDAYLNSNLADEGAATMNNVTVQREINANGGPDIGIAGNPANAPKYNAIMDQYAKDGDADKARNDIGRVFGKGERTSNTGQTYEDYYGGYYDKHFGKGK